MWTWLGDAALVRSFDGPLEQANASALALAHGLRGVAGVVDVVPAARSVLVRIAPGADVPAELIRALQNPPVRPSSPAGDEVVAIEVSYGGEDGPDLADVAAECGMTERAVVDAHVESGYRVAFLGFLPGFAYLLGLDRALHVPRLAVPRTSIPAGSVGVARGWTGVYPAATPGGWRIIGRTDLALFDAQRDPPALLRPGVTVRFVEA